MNAPGLFAYLLVFPACALLLHFTRWHSCSSSELGSARERALQWMINLALWMAPLCSYFPVFNQALAAPASVELE